MQSMDIVRVTDPRVHITQVEDAARIVHEGCSRITAVQIPAQGGGLNSSSTQFSFTVPQDHLLDRSILLQTQITFDTGTNLKSFALGSVSGLRQFPLNSLIQTIQVKINNMSVSDTIADRVKMLLCFGNKVDDRDKLWTTTAAMPDQFASYNDPASYLNRNPLAPFSDNPNETPRGAFRPVSGILTSGAAGNMNEVHLGATQAFRSLTYEITEPLILSPLSPGLFEDEQAFAHVNKVDITINWYPLVRAWSCSNAELAAMPNFVANFTQPAPQLLVNYLSPDAGQAIPSTQVLPYMTYLDYPKTDITIAGGATVKFVSDTIQTSRVPQRLFLWAVRSRSTFGPSTPDSFCAISNVNVTFQNDNTLLASCTRQDLYRITARNGINMSYPQWSFYRGGPLAIEFGVDIGLPPGLAPGVDGAYNLRVTCDFTNTDAAQHQFDFYMTTENNGVIVISANNAMGFDGIFDRQTVLAAKEVERPIDTYDSAGASVVGSGYAARGGSWFSNMLKGVVNKIAKIVKVAVPALAPQYSGISGPLSDLVISKTGGRLKKARKSRKMATLRLM